MHRSGLHRRARVVELQDALKSALQVLDPELRSIFLLREADRLSVEETAERLGLSTWAVKIGVDRARKEVCRLLWRYFQEPIPHESALHTAEAGREGAFRGRSFHRGLGSAG